MTTKDLKTRRVEAGITRKVAAEACGISQFKLDRIERSVDGIADDDRKAYDTGMAKLLAESAKTSTTNGTAKSTTAKPRTRTRKAAQPKSKAEDPAA